jgi:hypothetical protein
MDLTHQRNSIASSIKHFKETNGKMLVFPPGDKVERFMVHAEAEEQGLVSHSFGHDVDRSK